MDEPDEVGTDVGSGVDAVDVVSGDGAVVAAGGALPASGGIFSIMPTRSPFASVRLFAVMIN